MVVQGKTPIIYVSREIRGRDKDITAMIIEVWGKTDNLLLEWNDFIIARKSLPKSTSRGLQGQLGAVHNLPRIVIRELESQHLDRCGRGVVIPST